MKNVLSKISFSIVIVFLAGILMSSAATAENRDSGINDHAIAMTIVNINTATVKELSGLAGIGKKRAEAIIAYRNSHGDFSDIHDLRKVEGIGKKTFEKIKAHIAVN